MSQSRTEARRVRRKWMREDVLAQGVRMDGVAACDAVLGIGRTKAYPLLAAASSGDPDALPFPVLAVRTKGGGGTVRYVVPTAAVLALLGLTEPVEVR